MADIFRAYQTGAPPPAFTRDSTTAVWIDPTAESHRNPRFFRRFFTKDLSDPSALIHGIASALGFFALLFLPLWRALLALETDSPVMAWACFAALGLALVFFTLFVLSDKDRFQGTAVAREGLWEQLCLAAMYVPLLLDAIVHLISAP
ncbi:MAG: hypothetical protein ACLT1A_09295 [Dysosmobacter sp.]